MNSRANYNWPERKPAEHHVLAQLLKRGALPYRTAGGCLWVNTPTGCRLELRVVPSTGNGAGEERRFTVTDFRPRPELFFLCTEFDKDRMTSVWVLPSTVFFVYSEADEETGLRELNLDAKQERYFGEPFREYNSCFRNRWEPLIQFDRFRRFMKPLDAPDFAQRWEDFEDIMAMLEADENWEPEEDSITWEQYAAELTPALPD